MCVLGERGCGGGHGGGVGGGSNSRIETQTVLTMKNGEEVTFSFSDNWYTHNFLPSLQTHFVWNGFH